MIIIKLKRPFYIIISLLTLILVISGCSKQKNINDNKQISQFKSNITAKHNTIESFNAVKAPVSVRFVYTFKSELSEDEMQSIFKETADFVFENSMLDSLVDNKEKIESMFIEFRDNKNVYVYEGRRRLYNQSGEIMDNFKSWNVMKNSKSFKDFQYDYKSK